MYDTGRSRCEHRGRDFRGESVPGFVRENDKRLRVADLIREATGGRGIDVMGRGGDRIALFEPLLERQPRFMVRRTGSGNDD